MFFKPLPDLELMVILSPDKFDRNTEKPFQCLFEKPPVYVMPPNLLSNDMVNPIPHRNSVLVFEGGTDVNPMMYRQVAGKRTQKPDIERDRHEASYWRMAQSVNAASIGVCRGSQFLCVMSGGELIQHVEGHHKDHAMILPDAKKPITLYATSTHHQMMNPYVLEPNEWVSYGYAPENIAHGYKDQFNNKIKVWKKWKNWADQEIVWFKRTKSLAIQGHPEYFESPDAPFVVYCKHLIHSLIGRAGGHGIYTP